MITDGGVSDDRQEKPSRSARLLAKRRICFQHAGDLIKAAERALSEAPSLPNIAFHLTLLAIEEMGKAGLILRVRSRQEIVILAGSTSVSTIMPLSSCGAFGRLR
jgi:hypothetical protein